jgi:glutathione peroxidase
VLGFPSNDFGGQEPGSNEEIKTFCKRTYDVTFPMFAKVPVKGDDKIPLYGFLTASKGGSIGWNFTKFVIDRDGKVVDRFNSMTSPEAGAVTAAIEKALGK